MNTAQFALNKELLEAAEMCDLGKVEELLKQDADPLGSPDERDPEEHILGELLCSSVDDEKLAETMPDLLRLFFTYGMDIAARNIPADSEDNINPLWHLAFVNNEAGMKMLQVLLDHGLDCLSAEVLISHIFTDMGLCDGCDVDDEWWRERWSYALKMVMLAASYPPIPAGSTYIADCISLSENNADRLIDFRSWNRFTYEIDLSACDNMPHGLRNAIVQIKDAETNAIVWTMVI